MNTKIDHVAIKVSDLEENMRFFEEVFGMTVEKAAGEKPLRKVWFQEGIQLNETDERIMEYGIMDHIGIYTDHKELILKKSKMFGCTSLPNGENWFRTPTGIIIELK